MVLGLTEAVRYTRPGWPRFVVSALHKNAALLAVAALAVHIITSVLDTYAPIHIADVFFPFVSAYRPIWVGLGAVAVDLLLALVITSLVRERLGYRAWRAIHWTAFACWPVAVVHGLGSGSDTRLGWVQVIYLVCVAAVLLALWWRLAQGWSRVSASRRGTAVLASVVLPVAVAVWAFRGPLQSGWARRSGTPIALLGAQPVTSGSSGPGAATRPPAPWTVPFTARFQGTQQQSSPDGNGVLTVTIAGTFTGGGNGRLAIVLTGRPAGSGGGVELTGSQVSLGPNREPAAYRGQVTQLHASALSARVRNTAGATLTVAVVLRLDTAGGGVTGTVQVGT